MYLEEEKEDIFISSAIERRKNEHQCIKFSLEIRTNTKRTKAHLQREVFTLHITSSNNILTHNWKEFPRIYFLVNQSCMHREII